MGWLDVFRSEKKSSAQTAKERLQLVVAHRRSGGVGDQPEYFPQLQRDLLAVLRKYIEVGDDAVQMEIEREGDLEVLELNITLPESRH
ncbi:cell division topological specificity factor MinE [Salinisphaera sp.]|uniref:cell division topological specificity factor MinE n=1 Tax=Salinisphaera sp. TaxID=1914330 RepID=UPI000C58F2E7|nr:cell division topological specificity factor MinE [Salinisphaera sp.]MAS08669.1 cell division topological specificity factor MinE [Salinisphaera sp.]|tara:strand:- start:453 stop:716 length:264 start_codon:yes stop_codon:yes gene_type:complete